MSLWNSPVFLTTKSDGSSRFLVDFRAVNAKTEPLYCTLPSLDEIMDQVAEEKPQIFIVPTFEQVTMASGWTKPASYVRPFR